MGFFRRVPSHEQFRHFSYDRFRALFGVLCHWENGADTQALAAVCAFLHKLPPHEVKYLGKLVVFRRHGMPPFKGSCKNMNLFLRTLRFRDGGNQFVCPVFFVVGGQERAIYRS